MLAKNILKLEWTGNFTRFRLGKTFPADCSNLSGLSLNILLRGQQR